MLWMVGATHPTGRTVFRLQGSERFWSRLVPQTPLEPLVGGLKQPEGSLGIDLPLEKWKD